MQRTLPPSRRLCLHTGAALGLLALGACAGGPAEVASAQQADRPAPTPDRSAGGAAAAGSGSATRPPSLSVERDWLRAWFEGTPVVIEQRGEGPLSVQVPLAFSFEPRRATVKPALAAVLDKLAQSLRRSRAALPLLAAPADPAGSPALAVQRATAVRAHLLSRGVPMAQLGPPVAAGGGRRERAAARRAQPRVSPRACFTPA
jgi:outer membrane protein OmpA-like peptidoglycan-associated protein